MSQAETATPFQERLMGGKRSYKQGHFFALQAFWISKAAELLQDTVNHIVVLQVNSSQSPQACQESYLCSLEIKAL